MNLALVVVVVEKKKKFKYPEYNITFGFQWVLRARCEYQFDVGNCQKKKKKLGQNDYKMTCSER